MVIGNKTFDTKNNFYIMGIVNYTPDSFSDGGNYNNIDGALYRIENMINDGADIIDIGGESTRPNHVKISDDEEVSRILPLLEAARKRFDIPISLDTYKSGVVKQALPYIDMVNDIHGLKWDNELASIIAENNLACCIMHNRDNRNYGDFWGEFMADMKSSIDLAKSANIADNKIMIDAGIGFVKSYEQNLAAVNRTNELQSLGYPILIATSNKGFIGITTGNEVGDRIYGTVATTVIGAMKGASFFRVHDVKANRDALLMTQAIINEKSPSQ